MGILSNRVRRQDLQDGDHIYSWRAYYTYAHHGIHIGDGKVIHFTRGQGLEAGTGTFLDNFLGSWTAPQSTRLCEECSNHTVNSNGVMVSCIDCFLNGGPLYKFEYGVDTAIFLAKARGGTCTLAKSDSIDQVIHRALYLLENGFGGYHIFRNNCEDFALYCKTGLLILDETLPGRSGQAVSLMLGVPMVASFLNPSRLLVGAGVYCFSRYAVDLGVRKDTVKIDVEDLALNLNLLSSSSSSSS